MEALSQAYDSGHFDCARDLCVIIERALQEEARTAGVRSELRLPSFAHPESPENLLPQWRLIGFEMSTADELREIERLRFIPVCLREGYHVTWLPFVKWWSESVYIDGAGGGSPNIPLKRSDQIPYKKRRRVKRMDFIQRTRREIGAHYDEEVSETWNYFSLWNDGVSFSSVYKSGREWNNIDHPDHFLFENTISDATIRCVAEEVVQGLRNFLS